MFREKSCGAVVFVRNVEVHYLLLHYEAGHWDFVKGNAEPNESERDTVMRELREETGIVDAEFADGFREKIEYFYRRHGATISKEVVLFLVEAFSEKVVLSYEHVGYAWLDYPSAVEKLTFQSAKKALNKAHELIKLGEK